MCWLAYSFEDGLAKNPVFFADLDYHLQVAAQEHLEAAGHLDLCRHDEHVRGVVDCRVGDICVVGRDRKGTCSLGRCERDRVCV